MLPYHDTFYGFSSLAFKLHKEKSCMMQYIAIAIANKKEVYLPADILYEQCKNAVINADLSHGVSVGLILFPD